MAVHTSVPGENMIKLKTVLLTTLIALPFAMLIDTQTLLGQQASSPAGGKKFVTTQESVFRLDVRRVPLDVVVTDKQGNPVRGLKKSDFTIMEDGKVQKALSFEYEDGSVPSFVPPKLPPLPTNTFVNLPTEPERGPLYILYYDMVNTMPEDQAQLHKQLLQFVEKAQPGIRMALFVNASGLHLVQGFTSDHAKLRAAIEYRGPGPHLPNIFLNGENFGREDMGAAISNFNFIAEYLGGIPGRKNLIWLSGKFPMPYGPTRAEAPDFDIDIVKHTYAALMRSQVAVYPVDVKGVVLWEERSPSPAGNAAPDFASPSSDPDTQGTGGNGGSAAGGMAGYSVTAIDQQQEDQIALATGGHAYYSDNGVRQVMEKAVELGESYYTLSYSPSNTKYDGLERHIQVTLQGGKDYTLSYRRMYYAVPEGAITTGYKTDALQARFVAAKTEDTLYANIEHGAPMLHDLLFSAHVAARGTPAKATVEEMQQLEDSPAYFRTRHRNKTPKPLSPVNLQKYVIDYGVIDAQLKALAARGSKPPTLEFAVAAYDANGRLLNSMLNEGLASPEPGSNGKYGALFHAEQQLAVPPGAAWLRLAVRDKLNNRTGTMEVELPLKSDKASN
jgi:VWFA-related protein